MYGLGNAVAKPAQPASRNLFRTEEQSNDSVFFLVYGYSSPPLAHMHRLLEDFMRRMFWYTKTELDDALRIPPNSGLNLVKRWEENSSKHELDIERTKFAREVRKSRRLEAQIAEHRAELSRSVQSCHQAIGQNQFLTNTNVAMSHELQKLGLVVETLEVVIKMLFASSPQKYRDMATVEEEKVDSE